MSFHQFRQMVKHYYTLDNIVLLVALLMASGFVWSTMGALQDNYVLQRQVDVLQSQVDSNRLQADNLALENTYFASNEYLELQARQQFGKASPGEHMLVLPANTASDTVTSRANRSSSVTPSSNFQSWLNFFFGNKNT